MVSTAAAVVLTALAAFVVAFVVKYTQKISGLPGPQFGAGKRRFREERERAWVPLVQTFGKTFDYEGIIATADPTLVKRLLTTPAHVRQRSMLYKLFCALVPGARSLLLLDGDAWAVHHRVLTPKLSPTGGLMVMKALAQEFVAESSAWDAAGGQVPDLYAAVDAITGRFLARWGFGLDPQSPLVQEMLAAFRRWNDVCVNDMLDGPRVMMPFHYLRVCWIARRCRAIVARLLAAKAFEFGVQPNFVSAMVVAGFTPKAIADEMIQLWVSHLPSVYAITAGIFRIAHDASPTVIAALRTEGRAAFLGQGRDAPMYEDLKKLPLTMAAFKETLRLHTSSFGVVRRTGEPMDVLGQSYPAGTEIMIMLHALHCHPDHFANPDVWDPSRWKSTTDSQLFIPFLCGPRMCAGTHLAELEFATVLHAVLAKYNVAMTVDRLPLAFSMVARLERAVSATFTLK